MCIKKPCWPLLMATFLIIYLICINLQQEIMGGGESTVIFLYLFPSKILYLNSSWSTFILNWKQRSVLSHSLFVTPWTVAHQVPEFMGILQQEYWSELLCPPPGDLPNPETEPRSPTLQVDYLLSEPPRESKNTGVGSLSLLQGIFLTQESNQGHPALQADSLPPELTGKPPKQGYYY